MKIIKSLLITSLLLSSSQDMQAELLDRIVAVVNDDVVLQSEFENEFTAVFMRLRSQASSPEQLPPQDQIAQQVLEQLIVEKIQTQRAQRAGIQIPDAMVNQMIQNIAERNNVPVNQMPATLAKDGIDYVDFREDLRQQIAMQQLMQREIGNSVSVSESEIDRVLDQGNNSKEYKLNHILISLPSNSPAETIQRKKDEIAELRKRIIDGEDFSKLAIAYSNGSNALQGGDLGWRSINQIPSLFVETVNKLEVSQISEPIRSESGLHLIQVEDIRANSMNDLPPQMVNQFSVRHILIKNDELRTDEDMQSKLADIKAKILAGESFADLAREYSEDPGSATQGGDLGWAPANAYAPSFAEKVVSTPIDTVSEPFKSQFGWHILEVTEQRQYNAANDLLRDRARNALRDQKIEEESLLWRQRLRDEAYVDYRL